MDFLEDAIVEIVRAIWNCIKRIFQRVLQFFNNIVSFFKNPHRLRKLQSDPNLVAVAVKENLDNGNYNTVNCLFNKATSEVVDMQEDALGIQSEQLDAEASRNFGDKPMVVLS